MLLYVLGVVIVAVGLALSIGLHEIGHLVPAKRFGVKVGQYMIGFGPTLWSRRFGETQYGIKLLPFGGYISMAGMFPPARAGQRARTASTGFFDTLVQDAREASREGLTPADEDRVFYKLPVAKRIVIMLGGPLMNLVLSFVFFSIVLVGFGLPQYTTTIGTVYECVVPATSTQQECAPDDPAAPAAEAGILPGDRILAIDGVPVSTIEEVSAIITAAPGESLAVQVEREGRPITLDVTPLLTERPVEAEDGSVTTREVGFIGIGYAVENVRQPITAVPGYVWDTGVRVGTAIVTLPARVYDLATSTFGGTERDPEGLIGVVGIGRLAGEITSLDTLPVADRAANLLGLLGGLNLVLFLFNLIPLLPLDGGHVAGALWEAARRGIARMRGRPDPGPVDVARLIPVTLAVTGILAVLGVFTVFADIVNPITLF